MATRFYFPYEHIWPIPAMPAWDATWEETVVSAVVMSSTSSPSAAYLTRSASASHVGTTVAGPADIGIRQYISVPLSGAQNITGTVKGQHICFESATQANAMSQVVILVVSEDCQTVRGTLVAGHTNALSSEWSTSGGQSNRKNPLAALSPVTVSSVSASDRDRIVIQFGTRKTEAGTTSRNYNINFGTLSSTDLPEDETTTGTDNPWLEFSQTLTLENDHPRLGSMCLMGCGA